mmetsp:Transcript_54496/g.61656  ORF Transcript_54496/g.61656 Transcript_54496/m.61656 type:complete len:336 (+) Transcript_54496:90-1097(+)
MTIHRAITAVTIVSTIHVISAFCYYCKHRNYRHNNNLNPNTTERWRRTDSFISQALQKEQEQYQEEVTIRLTNSGKKVALISRTVTILDFSVTVWEWKDPAQVVNAYWEAQRQIMMTASFGSSQNSLLDPFGLVSWPGAVLASRELCLHAENAVKNKNVVVLGAGVGIETQTAAMLGAKRIVATDIHPTTIQQLEYGISRNEQIGNNIIVQTEILDLFATEREQPIPAPCDLLIVADVLYSETLASQVCRRCAEALEKNSNIRILITDSQRFVPGFIDELNKALTRVSSSTDQKGVNKAAATWKIQTMKKFKGSGVIIDEDQTYDVTVQSLWIGL